MTPGCDDIKFNSNNSKKCDYEHKSLDYPRLTIAAFLFDFSFGNLDVRNRGFREEG